MKNICQKIYPENWEQELMYQFVFDDGCRGKAYVCSPLSAKDNAGLVQNMRTARAYMHYAMKAMALRARAPHAYLPMLLCDYIPAERALALQFGISLMENCDIVLICGRRISCGMRGEIEHAVKLGIPMFAFDEGVWYEARKIVAQSGGEEDIVRLDRENYPLGFTDPVSHLKNAGMFL